MEMQIQPRKVRIENNFSDGSKSYSYGYLMGYATMYQELCDSMGTYRGVGQYPVAIVECTNHKVLTIQTEYIELLPYRYNNEDFQNFDKYLEEETNGQVSRFTK